MADILKVAQFARCLMLAKLEGKSPPEIAEREYRAGSQFMAKAGVAGEGRADGLLSQTIAATQFADVVRAQTVVGRLKTIRVPFTTPLPYIVALTPFGFVGERMAIKASAPEFGSSTPSFPRLKVAGLVVVSNELLMDSNSEAVLNRSMVSGLVAGIDLAFLDPSKAAVAFTQPAAVTHGSATLDATGGSTVDDVDGVAADLIALLAAAGSNLAGAKFITSIAIATALASMRGSGGQLAYPTIGVNGGSLAGLPLLVSGSSPGGQFTLIDESEVLLAEDDGVQFETSTAAMIEQSSAPTGDTGTPTAASATLTSMFQEESTALKVIQYVNFRMRNQFVAYATNFAPPAASFGSP